MTTKMLNVQNCVATGAPNQGNQNSIYDFYVVDEKVVVVPMKTLFCKRIIEAFNKSMKGVIMPNRCFANALIAADWFNERGFDVEVVEGTIEPNDYCFKWSEKTGRPVYSTKHPRLNEEPIEHRFCKKGDKYFCPTLEFLFGFDMVRCVDFTAIRVYDYQTLVAFAMETQHLFGEPHLHSSISGLSYTYVGGEETPIYWGNINDDGVYVSPTSNPFLIVDGLVAKAANHSQYA